MVSVKITLQHFILVFTEVFCITSSLEITKAAYVWLVVLSFISPSMSKTVITCKGGFPLSSYFYVRVHAVVYGRVCRRVW